MRKPVKLRTSWSLMHKIFFSIRYFILYKYFENNYVLPIMFWVMFYLSCFGLCFTRHICRHFYFLLICFNSYKCSPIILVGILLGMCPSVLFKNAFFFSRTIDYLCL